MRIGIGQIDSRVGDLQANATRIRAAARHAVAHEADLLVLPEMVLPGYPPRDLLYDREFLDDLDRALHHLARELPADLPVLVGTVKRSERGLLNGAALLRNHEVAAFVAKRLLAVDSVFHEARWFVPGGPQPPLAAAASLVNVLICEDLWHEGPATEFPADLLVCLNASPFRLGITEKRLGHARRARRPLVYVNAVGAQDELIFDGGSFAVDAAGRVVASLPRFAEAVDVVDLDRAEPLAEGLPPEDLRQALVLGIRGFFRKNGLRKAVLGLSGGVDSALAACLAAEALGPDAVTGVAIPSRYSDPRSAASARTLAAHLGIGFATVPLGPLHAAAEATLDGMLEGIPAENVQARLRAMILMAFVNRDGGVLLNTSNKTELSLGYGTLYGDLAGTLSPLGDLTKTQVYELARACPEIPPFILDRPPSAELRPDQVDPFDYDRIAPAVEALIQGQPSGLDPAEEEDLRRQIRAAEHKRWQGGIILKVSEVAFGSGRLVPVTARPTRTTAGPPASPPETGRARSR